MVGRALAVLSLPLGGACPRGEKGFENWCDMPCPALAPALHAQPVILYIALPFDISFGLACGDGRYTTVSGTAPSVRYPLRCIPVFPMGAPGVPCLRGGGVSVLVSAGQSPWLGPGSLCSVPCRALRLRWSVRRCLSAVAGGLGAFAWLHAGL